jgi:aspartate racemase
MGPKSTAPFVDAVVSECQRQYGARFDLDFPPMVILSWPTPFYVDRPIDAKALRDAIVDGVRRLAAWGGISVMGVPCNTAHAYMDDMRRAAGSVTLIDMTDLAVRELPASAKRVALLATKSTVDSGVYQRQIALQGREVLDVNYFRSDIDAVLNAIKSGQRAEAVWERLLTKLTEQKAETVLLACTDLNVIANEHPPAFPLVDAGAVLARELVARWRELAGR